MGQAYWNYQHAIAVTAASAAMEATFIQTVLVSRKLGMSDSPRQSVPNNDRAKIGGITDIKGMRCTRIEGGCTTDEEQAESRENTEEAHAATTSSQYLLAKKGIGEGAGKLA
ncbi:hypothetical protein BC827DRAFT_1155158 [Russula dissimulans]|nr:hypothetical protein BC827DRAFT_1155158 [Russula dissimulans]